MPKPKKDSGGKNCFPVGMRLNNFADKLEELLWFILWLDVDVEFHMLILWLENSSVTILGHRRSRDWELTFISRAIVSANVGID